MAKSEKQQPLEVVATTEIRDSKGKLINDFAAPAEKGTAIGAGQMTFTMWCISRNIPIQNRAGMRAFTNKQSATQQEWDAIFKRY